MQSGIARAAASRRGAKECREYLSSRPPRRGGNQPADPAAETLARSSHHDGSRDLVYGAKD